MKFKVNQWKAAIFQKLIKINWLAKQWYFWLGCFLFKKLRKIDGHAISNHPEEIRLFMIVRNEALRLPFIIAHYRELGVNRFFIVDNNSTDTTREFLLKQPDIHVFFTRAKYTGHWRWMEFLLERYGRGYWCLVVDADEVFIYPYYEELSLRELCNYLEQRQSNALHNLLVDMYPKEDLASNPYRAGEDLIQKCCWFDPYCYRKVLVQFYNNKANKPYYFREYYGGTRERVFGLTELCCSKISLLKYGKQTSLWQGMHSADVVNFSELQGVVLHFKFLWDFPARVKEEAAREEHWNNAYEYKVYLDKLQNGHFETPYHEGSIKYRDSRQLISLGFMKSSPGWETFLEKKANPVSHR